MNTELKIPCLVRGKFIFSGKHGLEILKGRFLNDFQFHIKNKNLILDRFLFANSSGKSYDTANLNHFMF